MSEEAKMREVLERALQPLRSVPVPLRIEMSRECMAQLDRAISHKHRAAFSPFGYPPPGHVDVRVLPEAPPGFWRVVWRCKACHGDAKATLTCKACLGKGEVYQP
jgi:hypothetical protein